MDYDDNDFQSQKFHLVGEDNTKFPPAIRSFALPKFDLDENLQVHLRFDSLVDTEVLLGIQNQEENHWIEDFSRGSSGIEFSSNAAESCSILRHNNVWSEASSSESVEMLLKSVGQDDAITKQTIIKKSDVCEGLDGLNNQMDPTLNQDDSVPSKIGSTVDTDPTQPPDKCLQTVVSLSKYSAEDHPHVEALPLTHKDEKSRYESSLELDPSSMDKKFDSYVNVAAEQCSLVPKATLSSLEKTSQGVHSLTTSEEARGNPDSVAFESMQVGPPATSLQNLVVGATDGCNEVVSCKKLEGLIEDISHKRESQILSQDARTDDNLVNFRSSVPKLDSLVHITGSSEAVFSVKPGELLKADTHQMDCSVLSKDSEMGDQTTGSMSQEASSLATEGDMHEQTTRSMPREASSVATEGDIYNQTTGSMPWEVSSVPTEGDIDLEGHSVEKGNDHIENASSPTVKMDSPVQTTGLNNVSCYEKPDNLLNDDDHQAERGISNKDTESDVQFTERKLGISSSVMEEKVEGELVENSNTDAGSLSSSIVKVCSPPDVIHEKQEVVEIKAGLDSSVLEAMDVTLHNPESAVMEMKMKMLDKLVENDSSNQDITSNVSGVHNSIGGISAEMHISSAQDAKLSQTCDNSLGDDHMVHSDGPILENEKTQSSTHLGNIGIEVGGYHEIEKRAESFSLAQSTTSVNAEVLGLSAQHGDVDESVSSGIILRDATQFASVKTLDQSNLVTDEVVEQKDGKPHLSLSNFIHLDKEETVNTISTQLCSSVLKENCQSHAVSGSIPVSDSGQQSVCNTAEEMLLETTAQSTSAENSVDIPQASLAITATQECVKELEAQPDVHASVMNQSAPEVPRVSFDKYDEASLDITGQTTSNGEILIQTTPSSRDGSSDDIMQNNQQCDEANLVSGDNNSGRVLFVATEGDLLNHCEESSLKPITLSENIDQLHSLEDGSGNLNSGEPNCGSPTVISCSEPSQSENDYQDCTGKESSHQNIPVNDDAQQMHSGIDTKIDIVNLTAHDPKENGASEEDRSFTFVVGSLESLPERESGKGWKPFFNIQGFESPQTAKESPTTGPCQTDPVIIQETSHGRHLLSDWKVHGTGKGTGGDKTRLVSGSAAESRTVAAGRMLAKETSHPKQITEKDGSPRSASVYSDGTTSRPMQVEEIAQYACSKGSSTKACHLSTVQTSGLPDLNTSASPTTMFHQPFTDLQQVQLRAQIFVYGSLIQGTAPDEACMISAFGDTSRDGGKCVWENVWRVAAERFHNQKSPLNKFKTPSHSHSGARESRCSPLQSVALSSPPSRTGSKGAPSAILNPSVTLSSPVWNFSTHDVLPSSSMSRGSLLDSHQSLSPLHPYPTLHMRPYAGNSTPWQSHAPGSGPCVVSPQTSAHDTSTHYSAFPIADAVQVTSVRDSSTPCASSVQLVPPSPLAHTGGHANVPANADLLMEEKRTRPGKHASANQKPKRRKKSLVSEEFGQISSVTQPHIEPPSSTRVTKYSTTSECILSPSPPASVGATGGLVSTSSPIASSTHYHIVGSGDTDQRVIFSEETCSRIEQAKQHAEDAAAVADSAVRHSQSIWNQLALQKNSGLVSEVEEKLASAAVAAAVAASVAKAAAAAAKVASDVALQAKLMADEALIMPKMRNCAQDSEIGVSDGGKNLGRISLALITKGNDKTKSSSSMIVAAREAARRRLEAASAAAKRAENLDALVKAAELAVEAVSQAGTVIAMGDPIPLTLTELVEAGPEGYWKARQNSTEHPIEANCIHVSERLNTVGAGEGLDNTVKHLSEPPLSKNETQRTIEEGKIHSTKDLPKDSVENQIELVNSLQKGFRKQKGHKMSDLSENIGVIPESEVGLRAPSLATQNDEDERHQLSRTPKEIEVKEGSLVEVVSDEDGLRGVWFSAKVLSLKDGKAYVCYTDLLQDEGPGQLKELIPLESEGGKAPRIRIAHPMTTMKIVGTRKRRRAAMGNYVWSVGDRVDAWMRDGWWEGIVTEKSNSDETKLTIHFPADGDSSIVRAWNLRPSLIWKDGQWIEWSRDNYLPHEVDTPQEKRQKLGRHEVEIDSQVMAGGNKQSKNPCIEDLREPEGSRPLMDKNFTVGKHMREGNISGALKMKRTGLQKEGSRVVFGIPKPGKKRKFMEVSKHYTADAVTKTIEGPDSVKFAKYLVPQGALGWKSISKVDIKGKRPTDSKPKLNSRKDRSIPSRSISIKDSTSVPVVSASSSSAGQDLLLNVKASIGHEENNLEKSSHLEVGSFPNTLKSAEGPVSFSPLELDSDVQSVKASSSDKAEGVTKGNLAAAGRKLTGDVEKGSSIPGNPIPDGIEPRRSNRRIQPTSRLLEGLQSSLIMANIPLLPHGKGVKTKHRSASSSRGNNHG